MKRSAFPLLSQKIITPRFIIRRKTTTRWLASLANIRARQSEVCPLSARLQALPSQIPLRRLRSGTFLHRTYHGFMYDAFLALTKARRFGSALSPASVCVVGSSRLPYKVGALSLFGRPLASKKSSLTFFVISFLLVGRFWNGGRHSQNISEIIILFLASTLGNGIKFVFLISVFLTFS